MKLAIDSKLISSCGMNCAICASYLAQKNDVKSKGIRMPYCVGCRPRNKNCALLKKDVASFQRAMLLFVLSVTAFHVITCWLLI